MAKTREQLLKEWIDEIVNSKQFRTDQGSQPKDNIELIIRNKKIAENKHWEDLERYFYLLQNSVEEGESDSITRISSHFIEWAETTSDHVEPWLVANVYYRLVVAHCEAGELSSAELALQELRNIFKEHDTPDIATLLLRAYNNAGVAFGHSGDNVKAIKLLKIAQKGVKHDSISIRIATATAKLNLGLIYDDIGEKSEIDQFRSIVKEYGNESNIWMKRITAASIFMIGHCYAIKKQYKKSIDTWSDLYKRFKSETDEQIHITLVQSLINLGVAYSKSNLTSKEIETYNLVIRKYGSSPVPDIQEQVSLARLYKRLTLRDMGKESESEQVLRDSIRNAKEIDDPNVQRLILRETLSGVIDRFSKEKAAFLEKMALRKAKIEKFLEKQSRFKENTSLIFILRQWNSFTPIITDGSESDRGGGYFIYHDNMGIVIDPGYDFLEHFHHIGGRIHDISHIIVTHAHDDHTAQLEQLLTMFHQYNKVGDKKRVTLILNHSTLKKFSGFSLHKDCGYIERIICINSFDSKSIQTINLSESCSVTALPAYHDDVFTEEYAVGLGFKFKYPGRKSRTIVFTGDTALFPPKKGADGKPIKFNSPQYRGITRVREDEPELVLYKNYPKEFNSSPDLFIPHIGSIQLYEFDPSKNTEEPMFYANHLGLMGTATMIRELDPTVTIVSEFGVELKDLRMQITEFLAIGLQEIQHSEKKKCIIPGDTSIVYNIKTAELLRHDDCHFHPNSEIVSKEVDGKRIGLFNPSGLSFSLNCFEATLSKYRGDANGVEATCKLPYFKELEKR